MWYCKRCETMNEESNSVCSLCGTLRTTPEPAVKQSKAEPQMGANYRYEQSAGQGDPRIGGEQKAGKAGGFKILAAVLFAFLAVAVGVIVFLINRASAPAGELMQATQQDTTHLPADPSKDANPTGEADLSAPKDHDPKNDVVDTAQYGAMEISDDFILTYMVDEAALVYRSANELRPYEMTLGVPLNGSAIVQMIDYNSRNIVDEQICASGSSIEFSGFPDGTYYFYVYGDGYAAYISEPIQYTHTESGYDGNGQSWGCSLVPINSTISAAFRIKLVDQASNPISNRGYNFGVPDALGSIQSCGWTTSNDEGYLTTWGMINDVEYYDVLEFAVYNDRVFKLYDENSDIEISAPKTGDEVGVVIN